MVHPDFIGGKTFETLNCPYALQPQTSHRACTRSHRSYWWLVADCRPVA